MPQQHSKSDDGALVREAIRHRRGITSGFRAERWLEGRDGDVLVGDFEDGEVSGAAGGLEDDAIAFGGFDERATEWGNVTDVVALEVDFIGTDDADGAFDAIGIGIANGGTEEDFFRRGTGPGGFGVNHDGGFDALHEEAEAGVDLAEAALAVLVVGVFAAIAVAGGPGDDFLDGGAFASEEEVVFGFETGEASGGDVVFERSGGGVGGGFAGEALAHGEWSLFSDDSGSIGGAVGMGGQVGMGLAGIERAI